MNDVKKLIYVIEVSCSDLGELRLLLNWIDEVGLDSVYQKLHYMYSEDHVLNQTKRCQ